MRQEISETAQQSRPPATLFLSQRDVSDLIREMDCIPVVEEAFRLHSEGKSLKPEMIHIDSVDGQFHVKAGGLELAERYFALKLNGDFPLNPARFGTSSLQGMIILCSGVDGYPLVVMDSREITLVRTGAATAVAAKYLASFNAKTVTICGCGAQGRAQLMALTKVLPIRKAFAFSRDQHRARVYADEMSAILEIEVDVANDLKRALGQSDVCITCTRATEFFIRKEDVPPGMFIAAVGADSPEKQELDPALLASSKIVVDIVSQCARVGELHHALDWGVSLDYVHAEIGDIISGKRPGRSSANEITIFDSTGTALQDVAAAAAIYKKAIEVGRGIAFDFFC